MESNFIRQLAVEQCRK